MKTDIKLIIPQQELDKVLNDYEHIGDLEETFDADQDVIDDNLNQGMKITRDGKPVQQVHLE